MLLPAIDSHMIFNKSTWESRLSDLWHFKVFWEFNTSIHCSDTLAELQVTKQHCPLQLYWPCVLIKC